MTTIATLKKGHTLLSNSLDYLDLMEALANWRAEKGYPAHVVAYWLRRQQQHGPHLALETLLGRFLMRLPYDANALRLQQALGASLAGIPVPHYTGTYQENLEIDRAIAESGDDAGYRDRIRRGAARMFSLEQFRVPSWAGTQTPIVILGAGPAGILIARTLLNAGYRSLRVLDSSPSYGGIWQRKEVQMTRNNPFAFSYEDARVEAAPGSGLAITSFLERLAAPPASMRMKSLPSVLQGTVVGVVPGDLAHQVTYRDQEGRLHSLTTPILINAMGAGEPLPLSRPGVIETDVPDDQGGIRWQHPFSLQEAEHFRGKRIVFVGLGNSTIEMVVQLQRWNALGYNIAYKVLTHYSREALEYPEYADRDGRRLYRDLRGPHLSRLAGDLDYVEAAFEHAWESPDRDQEEIIAEVCRWTVEQENGEQWMVVHTRNESTPRRFPFHRLYSLIGYGQSPEWIRAMGLLPTGDETLPVRIAHDYDGEVQQQVCQLGRDRLYPGYFGFGAVLASQNAQVIPGMLFRLPDLLVGVAMRTTEYVLRAKTGSALKNQHSEEV